MKKITCFDGHTLRKCPICQCENESNFSLVRKDKKGYGAKLKYKVFSSDCNKCEIFYQSPMLPHEFLNSVYSNYVGDYKAQEKRYNDGLIVRKSSALSFSNHIVNVDDFSILEIGSSSGYNLHNIRSVFDKVNLLGVDIDADAINFGRGKGNNLMAEDAFKLNKKFNIVFMNHVLEHISDPVQFVINIKKLLKVGGKLVINVPNSYEWKHKKNTREVLSFEHLNYFSEAGLKKLLSIAGYEVLSIETKVIHDELHPVPEIRTVSIVK